MIELKINLGAIGGNLSRTFSCLSVLHAKMVSQELTDIMLRVTHRPSEQIVWVPATDADSTTGYMSETMRARPVSTMQFSIFHREVENATSCPEAAELYRQLAASVRMGRLLTMEPRPLSEHAYSAAMARGAA